MKNYKKILSALVLILVASVTVNAQNEQSPYSKFGYGILRDYSTSMQRNMGGVGIAMTGGRQVNVMNPASYAGVDSLTLIWDLGIDLTRLWSKENSEKGKSFGGGLDYLTLQFPISKFMGGSIGLVPYSSVGYSFGADVTDKDGKEVGSSTFAGEGGISELYVGVGANLFKGFTLGANFSYQFGTIINDSYINDEYGTTSTLFERTMEIRDWNILLGLQYTMNFRQLHKVTIGANYSPKKDFHGKTWGTYYDINSDAKPDTVGYTRLKDGAYTKPHSFGVGVSYTYNDQFTVEGDFSYQQWSKANYATLFDEKGNPISESTRFDDKWKGALGLQYVASDRGAYHKRIAYRLGGFYSRDYIMVGDNHTREYGASIGFGFPTMGTKTVINLGFEYRRRQAYPAKNLVSENYFSITLGVNFNEFAFWQNKIR